MVFDNLEIMGRWVVLIENRLVVRWGGSLRRGWEVNRAEQMAALEANCSEAKHEPREGMTGFLQSLFSLFLSPGTPAPLLAISAHSAPVKSSRCRWQRKVVRLVWHLLSCLAFWEGDRQTHSAESAPELGSLLWAPSGLCAVLVIAHPQGVISFFACLSARGHSLNVLGVKKIK